MNKRGRAAALLRGGAPSVLLALLVALEMGLVVVPVSAYEVSFNQGTPTLKVPGSDARGVTTQVVNALNGFMIIMTSPWLSALIAVVFIALILIWLNNRQDPEFQARVGQMIAGVCLISTAPTIALLIYHPSGALL